MIKLLLDKAIAFHKLVKVIMCCALTNKTFVKRPCLLQ